MNKWILIVLILLLLFATGVHHITANSPAPVEVHMDTGDALYMYDCYPLSADSPDDIVMIVYINHNWGVAGYACEYGAGAWVRPVKPTSNLHAKWESQ